MKNYIGPVIACAAFAAAVAALCIFLAGKGRAANKQGNTV